MIANNDGIKLYMLCDSENGYCCNFELFTGRESAPAPSEYGAMYDLVMRLMSGHLNKGHHLYMDNYFTSPRLFYDLRLNATLACGTARSNRKGFPRLLKLSHPEKGSIDVMNNGVVVAVKFADRREVSLLTTIHEGKCLNVNSYLYNVLADNDCCFSKLHIHVYINYHSKCQIKISFF